MEKVIKLTEDNRMKIWLSSGKEGVIFDFNNTYKGYYPECRFTAVKAGGRLLYASGTDNTGLPHLFVSEFGSVWSPVNIAARLPFTKVGEYGDIIRILYDEKSSIPMLVTKNGYLVIIPDCPKCVTVRNVSDAPVKDAELSGDRVTITDNTGKIRDVLIRISHKFRCAWSFAESLIKEGGLLIDLRESDIATAQPLPYAKVVPDEFLEVLFGKLPKEQYLFFVCKRGYKSEQAVLEARNHGFINAYTLGSAADILDEIDAVEYNL